MILIEGAKNVGKTTKYDGLKCNNQFIFENIDSDYVIDRGILKQYVYYGADLYGSLNSVYVFDEIKILLPKNTTKYLELISKRMMVDNEFSIKMQKLVKQFNKTNKKELNLREVLILQIKRYIKIVENLSEYYNISFEKVVTNQEVLEIKLIKKGE